ncbi:MAG TPA: GNAT family N-acetyltransferase [Anaerolineales bacterium]|nr:GNAT family N-acetyltransferase [Anaerolineales bacterium]
MMNIQIRQMDSQSLHQVDQFNRNSMVNSHLMLHIQDNKISYSIIPVEPYEKILTVDPEDYTTFIDNPQKVIFFADVDGKPVGQIKMVPWWNKFTYVEELIVDTDFRGKGVGLALMNRAIAWAKQQGFPGVTLETQDNNVPACKFYEKCGFELSGFDIYAYKNLDNPSEIALYWYLIF